MKTCTNLWITTAVLVSVVAVGYACVSPGPCYIWDGDSWEPIGCHAASYPQCEWCYYCDNSGPGATCDCLPVCVSPVAVIEVEGFASGQPIAVVVGESLTFDGSASYDPDGTTLTYAWDFGDGCVLQGASGSHAWSHSGTYTVTLAVTDNDDPDCHPECPDHGDSAEVDVLVQVSIEIVDVDADDPHTTAVNYTTVPVDEVFPGTVSFSAPGTQDSCENPEGHFSFDYDQSAVVDVHEINLSLGGKDLATCTVTKEYKLPEVMETVLAYFLVEGVGLRLYPHKLREFYQPHVYSVPYSGKTVHASESTVLMDFGGDYENIGAWTEHHRYTWTGGQTAWVLMPPSGGLMPPTMRARHLDCDTWFPGDSLTGIAKCVGLLWLDDSGSSTPAVITNGEVDLSMN